MIKKVKKGFTLIELVVVIAVIAILSAVSVVAYVGITNSAKKSAAQQEADQVALTIKAAALASSSGYTEKENGSSAARYTVTWTSEGLLFKSLLTSGHMTVAAIITDMFTELEEKGLAEGAVIQVKSGANDVESKADPALTDAVKSFTYVAASKTTVSASF